MAFGNPYDEPWGPEIVEETVVWLKDIGVRTVSLADTVGMASPQMWRSCLRRGENYVAGIELECICTAGRIGPRRKFSRRMRRAAGDLTGRLRGWAAARLRETNWWEIFRPRRF